MPDGMDRVAEAVRAMVNAVEPWIARRHIFAKIRSGSAIRMPPVNASYHNEGNTSMNTTKKMYVEAMRADTNYPVYRRMIGIIAIIMKIVAVLAALMGTVSGFIQMGTSFLYGLFAILVALVAAALVYFLAQFYEEAAHIIADIADSVTEANSRASV